MAAAQAMRLDASKETNYPGIPKIELSKIDNVPYFIEKEFVRRIDDEYSYEEVPVEEYYEENEENLEATISKTLDTAKDKITLMEIPKSEMTTKAEVTDDFVRNFLVRLNLNQTLNCFQNEWYENVQKGKLKAEDAGIVPDIYVKNQDLNDRVKFLQFEVERYKTSAEKAKEAYVKMRKERDYHRMHHNRVAQEKNKLISDIRKLKAHYESYEPFLKTMKQKYDTAIREKVMNQLEKERAVAELTLIKSNEICPSSDQGPTQKKLEENRFKKQLMDNKKQVPEDLFIRDKHPNDSEFPSDNGVNPYLNKLKEDSHHVTSLRLTQSIQAHNLPISSISIHPRKMVAVTTSDDKTWKMWTIPDGQMIMRGEGHTDWVSGCDFHPTGKLLATSSGDSTVKIWNFEKEKCVHTFSDHLKAVWSVSWHSCGNFLASASMDNTAKIWDLNSLRCRYTLRGHADSVNSIEYLLFSNTLLTSSADKTISLWDSRTGLVAFTFYGHMNACNQASFNLRGDTIVSCDALGIVKLWDVRKVSLIETHDLGPYATNGVSFNPSGNLVVAASDDASIKVYNLTSQQVTALNGHEDAVHCVQFDLDGNYLLSGGCDNTLRVWS